MGLSCGGPWRQGFILMRTFIEKPPIICLQTDSINSIQKKILFTCLLACCFPYIKIFYATESDLQPAALCLAVLFICSTLPILARTKYSLNKWVLFGGLAAPAIFALVKVLIETDFTLRSAAYYVSIPVFFLIGIESTRSKLWTPKLLLLITLVWLCVGLVQKYYDPDFCYSLLRAPRTTANRGVVSLAAEPSFYSSQALMLLILNWLISPIRRHGNRIYISASLITELLLIYQILALSQSFFGVMLLAIFVTVRLCLYKPAASMLTGITGLWIWFIYGKNIADYFEANFTGRRIFSLLAQGLRNPMEILLKDQSAGERITDIVLSFHSLNLEPILSPGSNTSEWFNFVNVHQHDFNFLKFAAHGARIMSGTGTAIFELGTMGMAIALCFLLPLSNFSKKSVVVAFALSITLVAAIPLSMPLVGIILGLAIAPTRTQHSN